MTYKKESDSASAKLADLAREAGPAVAKELGEISKGVAKEFAKMPGEFLNQLIKILTP
jgi:hypothetical protein